jgi:hypothetical protein
MCHGNRLSVGRLRWCRRVVDTYGGVWGGEGVRSTRGTGDEHYWSSGGAHTSSPVDVRSGGGRDDAESAIPPNSTLKHVYTPPKRYNGLMRVSCGSGKPATNFYGSHVDPNGAHSNVPMCPRASLPRRPTWNKGTGHRAAQGSRSGSCKRIPNALDIVSHSTRQDPEDNRARTCTHAAACTKRPASHTDTT